MKKIYLVFFIGFTSSTLHSFEIIEKSRSFKIFDENIKVDQNKGGFVEFSTERPQTVSKHKNYSNLIDIRVVGNPISHRRASYKDITTLIPYIVNKFKENYPNYYINSFNLEIRYIDDLWHDYRNYIAEHIDESKGKVEPKNFWFHATTLNFAKSNKKIQKIHNTLGQHLPYLLNSTIYSGGEMQFNEDVLGRDWRDIFDDDNLYLINTPHVSFFLK